MFGSSGIGCDAGYSAGVETATEGTWNWWKLEQVSSSVLEGVCKWKMNEILKSDEKQRDGRNSGPGV